MPGRRASGASWPRWVSLAAELGTVGAALGGLYMFLAERPSRARSTIFQAWSVVAQAENKQASLGRPQAVRQLRESKESLAGIVLNGAVLRDADFSGTDLTGGALRGLKCDNCSFQKSTLYQVNLEDGAYKGERCTFVKATLGLVEANGAKFVDCNLDDAVLVRFQGNSSTSFNGASLKGARISNSNLRGTNFDNASLGGATIIDTAMDHARFQKAGVSSMRWISVKAAHAELNPVHGERPEFRTDTIMPFAKFDDSILNGAVFEDVDLHHASFFGATLHDAVFKDCTLTDADFTSADLRGARFVNCLIDGAIFRHAENVDAIDTFDNCKGTAAVMP